MKIVGPSLKMLPPSDRASSPSDLNSASNFGAKLNSKSAENSPAKNAAAENSSADNSAAKNRATRKNSTDSFDAQLRQAAQLYEAQFLREMVKGMRNSVPESDLMPKSQGEKIFQGMLDENYVDQWAARGGVGLADMIYDQLQQSSPGKSRGVK